MSKYNVITAKCLTFLETVLNIKRITLCKVCYFTPVKHYSKNKITFVYKLWKFYFHFAHDFYRILKFLLNLIKLNFDLLFLELKHMMSHYYIVI